MNILALETATPVAGVAVLSGGGLLFEEYADTGLTHSETIMPMAQRALEKCGLKAKDIDKLAVDIGPGSFTGIRIGVCAANAMGLALNIKVAGVDSLKTLAAGFPYFDGQVCALLDARGDQIYAALYDTSQGAPVEMIAPCALTMTEWLEKLGELDGRRTLLAGDGAVVHSQRLLEKLKDSAVFAPAFLNKPRASALAGLAESCDGLNEVMPLYLRIPQAERLKKA